MSDNRSSRTPIFPGVLLLATLAAWVGVRFSDPVGQPNPPPLAPPAEIVPSEDLAHVLATHKLRNREACDRLIERLEGMFEHYGLGIEPFVKDLTSWSTRLRILANMPRDWWDGEEGTRTKKLLRARFEEHIVSEKRLVNDLENAFRTLREDLLANRNTTLAAVRASLDQDDLPSLEWPLPEAFAADAHKALIIMAEGRAEDSVYHGLLTLVASEAASIMAFQIAAHALKSAAVSAAAVGGFSASVGTAGAGVGVVGGGPAGAAVGAVIGIGVGYIIDWIMTSRIERNLTQDLQEYLDNLRDGLIEGTEDHEGIRKELDQFCDDLNFAETSIFHRILQGAAP